MKQNMFSKAGGQERASMLALMQTLARNIAEAAVGARKTLFFSCVNILTESMSSNAPARVNSVLGQAFDDAATEGLAMVFAAEVTASRGRRGLSFLKTKNGFLC
jgi:hypothetical protein